MKDVNVVSLVCRLTRDPDLRATPGGTSVCNLRVAFSTSWKNASGDWEDRPNYADVTVWGGQGETCAKFLSKGRQIAVLGHLSWREFTDSNQNKRQVLEVVAEQVQFLGGGEDGGRGGAGAPATDVPGDFASAPAGPAGQDDDIPF